MFIEIKNNENKVLILNTDRMESIEEICDEKYRITCDKQSHVINKKEFIKIKQKLGLVANTTNNMTDQYNQLVKQLAGK